ncbi:MAG: dihydrolipoyl dehydrogenase [Clostridia bacterium]|nr:dihydrolipoyl dehydrogenase [Clostridia bacterium]
MKKYDIVVLGAGPGGYVSAIRAAQLGATTAIVEKNKVGGACLNAGCIPTKALIKNVEILHNIEMGRKRGIKVEKIELDYKQAIKVKDKAVKQLVRGVEGLLKSAGVEIYIGMGICRGNNYISVELQDGRIEEIEYGKLIIATGSEPAIPSIDGIETEGVVTSTELLARDTLMEHLIIVGGGVIGCEFASIFRAYGVQVTIVEMLPNLVAILDEDISHYMAEVLASMGVDIKLGKRVDKIEKNKDGTLNVLIEDENNKEKVTGDQVLISIGRVTNLEGLEVLNLETERKGIVVNDMLETSTPGVYAIGDVTGKKQLAHVASEMGIVAAENAMGAGKMMNLNIVPSCVYTIPEVGSVGITKKEAKKKGYNPVVGEFPLMFCGKAIATGEPDGVFKIVADKETRKILGAHFIGKSATELISEAAAFIKMGATIDDITDTIHAHPTVSESVAEAVRNIDGRSIHMPSE